MNNKDFLYSDLPKKRSEVVKYLLKNRKGSLIKILLLSIPFSLPLFFYLIYSRYFYMSLEESGVLNYCLLNAFPGLFLTFLYGAGLSGIFYSIRRLIFGETIRIPYHFFKGIKQSGFEFGLFTTLFYIIYVLLDIIDKTVFMYANSLYPIVTLLILLIDILLFYILFYVLSSASLYVVSFIQAFKDAFNNAFRNFKNNIINFIIGFHPLIFVYFYSNSLFLYLNIIGFIIMLFPFNILGPLFNLPVAYTLFDETINKDEYPNYYKKGLYRDEV